MPICAIFAVEAASCVMAVSLYVSKSFLPPLRDRTRADVTCTYSRTGVPQI